MAWYDSVAGLSAVHAWDALGHTAIGGLTDRVGSVTCGTTWAPNQTNKNLVGCAGDGSNQVYSSPIALPTDYTIVFFAYVGYQAIEYLYHSSSTSELWHDNINNLYARRGSNTSSLLGTVPTSVPAFIALTRNATTGKIRAYINNSWSSAEQSDASAPSHTALIGYSGSYAFRSSQSLFAHAIFDSAASLTQLQALETAARDALAQGMFVYQSGAWKPVENLNVSTA